MLFVGFLRHEKGVDTLLAAFHRLLKDLPDAELEIVGGRDTVEQGVAGDLARQLDDLGQYAKVVHHGHLEFGPKLFQIFADADILAVPSRSEGTPRVLIEARSFGCTVVGSNVGGIPSSISDGVDGLIVPPDDPAALCAAMLRIAHDRKLHQRLIDGGVARAELHGRGLRRFDFRRGDAALRAVVRRWGRSQVFTTTLRDAMNPPGTSEKSILRTIAPFLGIVVVGIAMFFFTRGTHHYRPPNYGGFEPRQTQIAAMEILASGTTEMEFHATGYSYLVALVYLFLPPLPLSVLAIQIAALPLVVWSVGRMARSMGGAEIEEWGRWAACLYYPFGYYATAFSSIFFAFVFLSLSIAWLLPLVDSRRSVWRSVVVGTALGVVVCLRPNFALFGVVFLLSIWQGTRNFWEAIIRSLPIAAVSVGMLVAMTWFNPPPPGDLVRGVHAVSRGLLQGTYQYADTWWDWEWFGDNPDDPQWQLFITQLHRIQAETGKTIFLSDGQIWARDKEAQVALKKAAFERIADHPAMYLKKVAISSVRGWITIPTQLSSWWIKVPVAIQEFLVLGLAIAGFIVAKLRGGPWLLALGVVFVPTFWNCLLSVEPRYTLPGRGMLIALMSVALATMWHGGPKNLARAKTISLSAGPTQPTGEN